LGIPTGRILNWFEGVDGVGSRRSRGREVGNGIEELGGMSIARGVSEFGPRLKGWKKVLDGVRKGRGLVRNREGEEGGKSTVETEIS